MAFLTKPHSLRTLGAADVPQIGRSTARAATYGGCMYYNDTIHVSFSPATQRVMDSGAVVA